MNSLPRGETEGNSNRPGDEQTFAQLTQFRFPALVSRVAKKLALPHDEVEALFEDLKLWLFLCGTARQGDPTLAIVSGLSIIDELWHEFILFTKDYADFCERFFGRFLHHIPTTEDEAKEWKAEFNAAPEAMRAKQLREMREAVSYIYDRLGERVTVRWFSEFPREYPPNRLKELLASALLNDRDLAVQSARSV